MLYRIQEYSLRIPPLRERAQLEAFILQLWRELGGERRDIRLLPEALAMLARYPWPGNVRQLLSTLKVLLALADDHAVLTRTICRSPSRCWRRARITPIPAGGAAGGDRQGGR